MKKQLRLLFFSFVMLSLLSAPSAAAGDSSYQSLADHFFELLSRGKAGDAVDELLGTNPAIKKLPDQIDQLRSQFGSLGTLMGNYVSHTKLIETKVADLFVYQHYVVAYDRQPISVRMSFYKPGGKWLCQSLQFDADFPSLIQKRADDSLRLETQY